MQSFSCPQATPVAPAHPGKIEARNTLSNSLRSSIDSSKRELFDPIFITPSGSFAFGRQAPQPGSQGPGTPHMVNARLSVLQSQVLIVFTLECA